MNIPENVRIVMNKLNESDKEAFLVGGCVRDFLMGLTPNDWDIATNATPSEILKIFKDFKQDYKGIAYGTVVIIVNGENVEVTTYRKDGEYLDGRHPEEVFFSDSITEDLSRRDFTINAIAYSPEKGFIDPFNGLNDINNKLIKCVRDPDERFIEDPVRILRGIRFAAKLGFKIDEETEKSMFENKRFLRFVTFERYSKEFKKISHEKVFPEILDKYWEILFSREKSLLDFIGFDQKHPHHVYDLKQHTIEAIKNYQGDNYLIKIALLLHDVGKPYSQTFGPDGVAHYYGHAKLSEEIARDILYELRFEVEEIEYITLLIKHHDSKIPIEDFPLKKWILKYGEKTIMDMLDVSMADCLAHNPNFIEKRKNYIEKVRNRIPEIIKEISIPNKKHLKINGYDIISLGFSEGKKIGEILDDVFDKVLAEELINNKDVLLNYIKEKYL